jgi:diguanylate cyclase (GGDEF)-like protein
LRRLAQLIDGSLLMLGARLLPLAIVLFSLVAFVMWSDPPGDAASLSLPVRGLQGGGHPPQPGDAGAALRAEPVQAEFRVRLSDAAVWWAVDVPEQPDVAERVLEFPSRHALDVRCWDAHALTLLGQASRRDGAQGDMVPARAGFALRLPGASPARTVLCQGHFAGPARVTAVLGTPDALEDASRAYDRNFGLLDGGMVVLALSVAIAGLINRDVTFLLLFSWLMLNLRMATLSADWGAHWLGNVLPIDWQVPLRSISLALYYTLTITLFRSLFRDELGRIASRPWMDAMLWSCWPLLLLSLLLPYNRFLPVVWVCSAVGVLVLGLLLVKILVEVRSRAAVWYAAAIGVSLFASLHEVLSAGLGLKGVLWAINSVTAALASSLLASVAIAERLREEHRQRLQAQSDLEHTFQVTPIGLFSLNLGGRFTGANPAMLEMLEHSEARLLDTDWAGLFGAEAWSAMLRTVMANQDVDAEIDGPRKGDAAGPVRRYLVKAALAGERIEGSLQDVTEKSRAVDRLQFLVRHDPLTGVLNRRGLEAAMDEAQRHLSGGAGLCLAYLDLDRFKLINDLYGHSAGDEVLQQVCQRIQTRLPERMQLGRLGGDEFLLVMPQTPIDSAEVVAQEVLQHLTSRLFQVGRRAFQLRASMGLIEVQQPGLAFKEAVSNADRACSEAKRSKVDGLVVYRAESRMFTAHEAERKLAARLAQGDFLQDLYLVMQPIMSLKHPHASLNFEVLLRMRDEQGAALPTDRLIAAAEASGRMTEIDRWVLASTLAWIDQHEQELRNNPLVCVNLSGTSLNDERFKEDVFALFDQHLPVLSRLCLEITESVALRDLGNTRMFIERVRAYGAKVALDDFGAGYTSFTYLKDLPADILKIDGSFIVNMTRHPANVAIVETMVNLAQNLGMKTIAEWAEDQDTLETLAEIGGDYVQGFVVARPQSPSALLGPASSASFIQDESVRLYASDLSEGRAGAHLLTVFQSPDAPAGNTGDGSGG